MSTQVGNPNSLIIDSYKSRNKLAMESKLVSPIATFYFPILTRLLPARFLPLVQLL
jgi:hypothetical protein